MMQFYTEKTRENEQPNQEIIQYLINYSKELRIVKTNENHCIELHLN